MNIFLKIIYVFLSFFVFSIFFTQLNDEVNGQRVEYLIGSVILFVLWLYSLKFAWEIIDIKTNKFD